MKTDSTKLPDGVAESWFHISCGGEVWISRVCQGRDLLKVLDELAPGSECYSETLADVDSWYVLDGRCCTISLPCGEDPDIEICLIDDPWLLNRLRQWSTHESAIELKPARGLADS